MQRLPSTQALRALESFSRHGTVWGAADELNLTRSAVSHQLRMLERDLDFALFNRVGTRIELTARGKAYTKDIMSALVIISESAQRNAGHGLTGQFTVSCTPGFAATWLSRKIKRFREICPDIELSIITPKFLDDTSNPNADLFIAFGVGKSEGVEVELLKEVEFTPLLSPALLNRLGGISSPTDVFRTDLLHLADRDDWKAWMKIAEVENDIAANGIVFADMNLVYAAALNAQGIAMGDEFICRDAMNSGQLVRPFDLAIKSPKSYFLATPKAKIEMRSVIAFREWILSELPDRKS
ncbi:MAG: LysR substrate-binding domain-containing protein [Salaquimonas sp.]